MVCQTISMEDKGTDSVHILFISYSKKSICYV